MPPNQVIKHPADASASSHASTLTQFGQLAGVKQVARGGGRGKGRGRNTVSTKGVGIYRKRAPNWANQQD